jgi:signal transduction histidine kinase
MLLHYFIRYDAFGNAALHRRAVYRHGGAIWDVVPHPSDTSELLFTACSDGNVYTWTV